MGFPRRQLLRILSYAFGSSFILPRRGFAMAAQNPAIGVGVILASILLTGIYVYRANQTFDPLIREIMEDASK